MHEQPPSGCTRTPEAAGAPPPGFISGSPLARQHGPSHAGLLRGRVARHFACATERTFVRARSSHALPTAAPTPLAPNGCADGGGRSSSSPGALRQQSQRPRFSPAVRRLSHLILARLGTVFRAPREGPDPALQPGRQTAAPADGRGAPASRGRLGLAQEARPTPALAPLAEPGSGEERRGEAGRPKPHGSPHQRRLSTVPSGPRVTAGPATRAPAPAEGARPRGGPSPSAEAPGPPGGFPQRVGWDRCAPHPRRPASLGCGKLPKGQCRSEGWALAGGQEGFRRR